MAQHLVHAVVNVLAPGVIPLFLTDQLASYTKAVLSHFGCWVERVSEKSGRILHRWMPDARLRYAQLRKQRRLHKIVAVTTKVVFGTKEAVRAALTAVGHRINTSFVERLNRTLRAHVPGLARGEEGLAKSEEGLLRRLLLVMGYYNGLEGTSRGQLCNSRTAGIMSATTVVSESRALHLKKRIAQVPVTCPRGDGGDP